MSTGCANRSSVPGFLRRGGWAVAAAMLLVACDDGGDGSDAADLRADVSDVADAVDAADVPGDPGVADTPLDGTDAPDTLAVPGKVRFLHISDLHVYGDGANPLTEPLQRAVDVLNALDFEADFLVATGDYVDFLPDELEPGDPSTFTAAIDTMKGLRYPVRTMAGNHEYYRNEMLEPTRDKAGKDAYLVAAMGHPLDESFDRHGVRFIQMNTMQGDLWEKNQGLLASFTDAQMTWLRTLLDEGLPTVLLLHHPPTSGAVTPDGDALCQAIEDHPGVVKAVFAGHLHGFWKGEACGLPYYLVANTDADKPFFFEVEADAVTGEVTIVNDADIPWGEVPSFECDPDAPGLEDPNGLEGTNQVIHVGSMTSNLAGLEGFEGDGLDKVPLVLRLDSWNGGTGELTARMSQGVLDAGFVQYLEGAPCAPMTFQVEGACATSVDTGFQLNLLPLLKTMLQVTPDPSWKARLDITSLRLEGRLAKPGERPLFEAGLVNLTASGTRALEDIKSILVVEYCGGRIEGCVPGEGAYPACPSEAGAAFFDQVPEDCDVSIGSYSLRLILGLLGGYPLENVTITGGFTTEPLPDSATPAEGTVDATMFSTGAGTNCAPVP